MAILNLVVIEGGIRKQKASNTQTVDFSSIRIGASNLQILETSGEFDFSAKKLTNLAAAVNPSDAVRYDQLPVVGTDFADNTFRISDDVTPSKKIAFQAAGISASTVRTITMPDADVDLGALTNSNISASAAIALSKLATLSANRALSTDGSGVIVPSAVTATELGYLAGVTSAVQSQLNAKLNLSGGTMTGAIAMGANQITGLADPTLAQDAATKNYVDMVALGLAPKKAVHLATTANITLSGEQTIDGVLTSTSRVLVKNQTAPEENGIYVSASGAWARASDMDSLTPIDEVNGAWVPVQAGSQAGEIFVQYGTVAAIGTDPINFEFYNPLAALVGGDMIINSGSTFSVDLSSTGGLESTNPGNSSGQLKIKLLDSSLALAAGGTKVNLDEDTLTLNSTVQVQHARTFVNDNLSPIVANQVVYIKSNGAVDLAIASTSGLDSIWIGVVKSASIPAEDPGLVNVRPGAIISGLSGLTPGLKQYVSRATAGDLTEVLTGFVTGEHVYSVGYAISATEMVYQPQFEYVF